MLDIQEAKKYLDKNLSDQQVKDILESVYAFVGYSLDKLPELGMLKED